MKRRPKILVITGYGLNCEEETKYAFDLAGGQSDIIHINDCISRTNILDHYQVVAIPGGFSYGDDTGSGNAFAFKIRNHMWDAIVKFVEKDHLVIGICNGCQILVNVGLIPAIGGAYGVRQVALLPNDNARYTVRWTDLRVCSDSPWLRDIDKLSLPIAHGEGKFFAERTVLANLLKHEQIALRYTKGDICDRTGLSPNPTGTVDDIAAITDGSKRILGMMPHPERAIDFHQLPQWTIVQEEYLRKGMSIPSHGPGFDIFVNAINYFQK
jgi:phosphoribosylformylglycinamidine synthase